MADFFAVDGKYYKFTEKFGNIFWLNLLCFVCCIPVITIGPALTACYAVMLRIVKNEEGNVTRSFFRAFRQNFKQAVVLWFLFTFTFLILLSGMYILRMTDNTGNSVIPLSSVFLVINSALILLAAMTMGYAFPLLAKFENTVLQTIQNALILSVRHFSKTALIVLINAVFPVALGFVLLKEETVWLLSFLLCFGLSGPAYACSLLLLPIFRSCISGEEEENVGDGNL